MDNQFYLRDDVSNSEQFRLWLELKLPTAEKFWLWLAWKLPRPLVKWCAYRVGAHATTGQYGSTIVPELYMMDALKRWDIPDGAELHQ